MKIRFIIIFGFLSFCITTNFAQEYYNSNRHSTNSFDGWISCTTSANPNSNRPVSHWIMYDLRTNYYLNTSHIWNVNDPDNLDAGIKELAVDYSDDGVNWTEMGVFEMEQSDGSLFYNGIVGPNFSNNRMRYILFTAIETYGSSCAGFSEFVVNVTDPLLPLTLLNFDVNCDESNNNVQIKWTTEDEYNIASFDIEKSIDGNSWDMVKSISSKGNKIGQQAYELIDDNAAKYYRLKIIDLDNTYNYSDLQQSNCEEIKNFIQLYPNPVNENMVLSLSTKDVSFFECKIFNSLGKMVHNEKVIATSDYTNHAMNVSQLIPGEYYISVLMNKDVHKVKFVVL